MQGRVTQWGVPTRSWPGALKNWRTRLCCCYCFVCLFCCCVVFVEDVPLVEFLDLYLLACQVRVTNRRRLRSLLLLYLCDVFRALINSFVCWFCCCLFFVFVHSIWNQLDRAIRQNLQLQGFSLIFSLLYPLDNTYFQKAGSFHDEGCSRSEYFPACRSV